MGQGPEMCPWHQVWLSRDLARPRGCGRDSQAGPLFQHMGLGGELRWVISRAGSQETWLAPALPGVSLHLAGCLSFPH